MSDNEWTGPIEDAAEALGEAIVGHRIASLYRRGRYGKDLRLMLDDGRVVEMEAISDCCAFAEVEGLVQQLPTLDHIITAVTTTDWGTSWHILADAGEVLSLDVAWSEGNGYYAYGFYINVKNPEATHA